MTCQAALKSAETKLRGFHNALPPLTLAGELRLPQGVSGRLPAVILVHGSGGTGSREEFWAKYFNSMGIASFVIDSFSGRGLVDVNPAQALLGRFNMVLDTYRAYDVLANHPRIDSTRIVAMGFSRGGQAVLDASFTRFQQTWRPGIAFAAYIPLYASCSIAIIGDTEVSPVPIRQFHGAADDYVPVAPCRAYYQRLRAAGANAALTEFPDANHVFDNPLAPQTPTFFRTAFAVVALIWIHSAAADPALNELAARTELRAFESLTLTDQQFLTGDNGDSATVSSPGLARWPQNARNSSGLVFKYVRHAARVHRDAFDELLVEPQQLHGKHCGPEKLRTGDRRR